MCDSAEPINDLCLSGTKHSHAPISNKCSSSYENEDYLTALREWELLAEQGNAHAEYNLGQLYNRGQGVQQDTETAGKWYTLAAEKGFAFAQHNLAVMYHRGRGVKQDYKTAVKWYKLAAKQGVAYAQYNLGNLFENGKGVQQDYKTAVKWYKLASEQGDAYAQNSLGNMYENGKGVPKDYKIAVTWYKLAAKQGDTYAQNNLSLLLKKVKNTQKTPAVTVKKSSTPNTSVEKSSGANWTKVGKNVKGSIYVDFERIRKVDGNVFYWQLGDFLEPAEGFLSITMYRQLDCNLFRFKTLSWSFHKEPMGGGSRKTLSVPKEHKNWNYPPPKSGNEIILEAVCSR